MGCFSQQCENVWCVGVLYKGVKVYCCDYWQWCGEMYYCCQVNICVCQGNKVGGGVFIDVVGQSGVDNFVQ